MLSRNPDSIGGFTLLEVLVSLAIFSLTFTAILELMRWSEGLHQRADQLERARLAAEDLYEELVPLPNVGPRGFAESLPRPARFGSVAGYHAYTDSPVSDPLGHSVAWARDLYRKVAISGGDTGATVSTGWLEVTIEVGDIRTGAMVVQGKFRRTGFRR